MEYPTETDRSPSSRILEEKLQILQKIADRAKPFADPFNIFFDLARYREVLREALAELKNLA